ncbi:MAG: YtxH domain-containing protein [Anaerolineae bacterium]|nr:YtxH domain-containing protein [Anaerolineae bacterium]
MRRVMFFGVGLLVGAAVGSALVMLVTPVSGDDIRKRLKGHLNDARDAAKQAAETMRKDLEAEYLALTSGPRRKVR